MLNTGLGFFLIIHNFSYFSFLWANMFYVVFLHRCRGTGLVVIRAESAAECGNSSLAFTGANQFTLAEVQGHYLLRFTSGCQDGFAGITF